MWEGGPTSGRSGSCPVLGGGLASEGTASKERWTHDHGIRRVYNNLVEIEKLIADRLWR